MAEDPRWLNTVVGAERRLAVPINRAFNSSRSAGMLLRASDGSRLVRGAVHRMRSAVVHALALPSRRDVQLLQAQVQQLQRALEHRLMPPDSVDPP